VARCIETRTWDPPTVRRKLLPLLIEWDAQVRESPLLCGLPNCYVKLGFWRQYIVQDMLSHLPHVDLRRWGLSAPSSFRIGKKAK